jgi:hypothetical protein
VRRAVRWLAAGGLLLVVALVGGALVTRESSEPASPSSTVARFRAQIREVGAVRDSPSVPAAGVYRYATVGGEQATALGTRKHAYPKETTVTVVPTTCGWRERWDALTTRFEERTYCPGADGLAITSFTDGHAFFGRTDRRTYRCTAGSLAAPPPDARRATWTSSCLIPGTRIEERGRVVGTETLTVGTTRVPTIHLRSRSRNSGDTVGTGVTDRWLARPSGLLVRALVFNESATKTVAGDVPYRERYELSLISLRPLR